MWSYDYPVEGREKGLRSKPRAGTRDADLYKAFKLRFDQHTQQTKETQM